MDQRPPTDIGEPNGRNTAACLVRSDVSGRDTPRHALLTNRRAVQLGYICLYTMRPPADHPDPVGYAVALAGALAVDALVIYDLATVDNMPSRVCEAFDLETVSPPTTWAAELPIVTDPGHSYPDHALTVPEAQHTMRQHIGCRAVECARKASAYACLVQAGKIVPPVATPRERAAARGISFQPHRSEPSPPSSPGLKTLLAVLDGLTDPAADHQLLAANLSTSNGEW